MIPILEPDRVSGCFLEATVCSLDELEGLRLDYIKHFENYVPTPSHRTVPWGGTIRWALRNSTVFEDAEEERLASFSAPWLAFKKGNASSLWFFQYGLRYLPSEMDENAYRTVKMENLPLDITMDIVLQLARGGQIYSAQLLNTTHMTGSPTAILVFVYQRDAVRFLQSNKDGISYMTSKIKVRAVNTATYPMPAEMEYLIFQRGYTRCLAICGVNGVQVEEIFSRLMESTCFHYVESVFPCEDGVQRFWFHSIKMAAMAHDLLKALPMLKRCEIKFEADPCTDLD
ncbi:hypothetical protein ASPZODRAFT_119138 [Penicilliopsis zonata CBS 506.65]|uniref:RRM domain-containing protein n=1 Tax=Penicilliopsis zonata CBS 506.65 TaxID=1073090 RepID=A0A1L9SFL0_9EURO|nr:hypothetical protein ASPZODRAFT_119138 [Penicilliopsis zonata CBS 506.65]OJJ45877.1 hypothetical protein ASPZODRAFT_119138 [Penicilliopsis zonata CBS 506.65]